MDLDQTHDLRIYSCMHDMRSAPVQELLENLERQAGRPDSPVYPHTDADMGTASFTGMSQGTDTAHSIQSSRSGADRALQSLSYSGIGAIWKLGCMSLVTWYLDSGS